MSDRSKEEVSCLDFLVSAYFHNENIVKGESLKQSQPIKFRNSLK